jgi:hypothetical protein
MFLMLEIEQNFNLINQRVTSMLETSQKLLISSGNRHRHHWVFLIMFILSVIACSDSLQSKHDKKILSELFTCQFLANDIELFIRMNDSTDYFTKKQGMVVYKEDIYTCSFFRCEDKYVFTISQLGFLNMDWIKDSGYQGYIKFNGKFIFFSIHDNAPICMDTSLLQKGIPSGLPDENSKIALQTNHGGNYRTLIYEIKPNQGVSLIAQNPIDYIKILENDTIIFPCF